MHDALLHKAKEFKPATRAALEDELGRPLQDDEEVSILTYVPHDAPQERREKSQHKNYEPTLQRRMLEARIQKRKSNKRYKRRCAA
jgi:hypothetical protein